MSRFNCKDTFSFEKEVRADRNAQNVFKNKFKANLDLFLNHIEQQILERDIRFYTPDEYWENEALVELAARLTRKRARQCVYMGGDDANPILIEKCMADDADPVLIEKYTIGKVDSALIEKYIADAIKWRLAYDLADEALLIAKEFDRPILGLRKIAENIEFMQEILLSGYVREIVIMKSMIGNTGPIKLDGEYSSEDIKKRLFNAIRINKHFALRCANGLLQGADTLSDEERKEVLLHIVNLTDTDENRRALENRTMTQGYYEECVLRLAKAAEELGDIEEDHMKAVEWYLVSARNFVAGADDTLKSLQERQKSIEEVLKHISILSKQQKLEMREVVRQHFLSLQTIAKNDRSTSSVIEKSSLRLQKQAALEKDLALVRLINSWLRYTPLEEVTEILIENGLKQEEVQKLIEKSKTWHLHDATEIVALEMGLNKISNGENNDINATILYAIVPTAKMLKRLDDATAACSTEAASLNKRILLINKLTDTLCTKLNNLGWGDSR